MEEVLMVELSPPPLPLPGGIEARLWSLRTEPAMFVVVKLLLRISGFVAWFSLQYKTATYCEVDRLVAVCEKDGDQRVLGWYGIDRKH